MRAISFHTIRNGIDILIEFNSDKMGFQVMIELANILNFDLESNIGLYIGDGTKLFLVDCYKYLSDYDIKDGMFIHLLPYKRNNLNFFNISTMMCDISEFKKVHTIHKGSVGNVYSVRRNNRKKLYAVKIYCTELVNQVAFINYVNLIASIQHPLIIRLQNFSLMNPTAIVMDFMKYGSLADIFDHRIKLSDLQKMKIIFGIAVSIEFLHANTVSHQNLKPSNVLLNENIEPVLTDISCASGNEKESKTNKENMFQAPEILEQIDLTEKIDIFAFGSLVYLIINEQLPDSTETIQEISNGNFTNFPNTIQDCFKSLIKNCWNHDPLKRPPMVQIVEDLKNQKIILPNINQSEYDDFIMRTSLTESSVITTTSTKKEEKKKVTIKIDPPIPPPLPVIQSIPLPDPMKIAQTISADISLETMMPPPRVNESHKRVNIKKPNETESLPKADPALQFSTQIPKHKNQGASKFPFSFKKPLVVKEPTVNKDPEPVKEPETEPEASMDTPPVVRTNPLPPPQKSHSHPPETIQDLRTKAEHGDPEAQDEYGVKLITGDGCSENPEEGMEYLKASAERKCPAGLYHYGYYMNKKLGSGEDNEEGYNFIRESADLGYELAQLRMGVHLLRKFKTEEAIAYLIKAEQAGNDNATFRLAQYYYKEPGYKQYSIALLQKLVKKNEKRGLLEYGNLIVKGDIDSEPKLNGVMLIKQAADLGEKEAILKYGKLQIHGVNGACEPNRELGLEYVKKAAEFEDFIEARYYLSTLYLKSEEPDEVNLGMKILKECVDESFSEALYSYGELLYNGKAGLPKDEEQGLRYVRRAADAGSLKACYYIGKIYKLKNDFNNALRYLKIAADKENSVAIYEYARLLITGPRDVRDQETAIEYLEKIATEDNQIAMNLLGSVYVGRYGKTDEENFPRGIELLESSFKQGNIDSGHLLTKVYKKLGNQYNNKILEIYQKLSDDGDPLGKFFLGYSLVFGEICPKDTVEGVKILLDAAAMNNEKALDLLGVMFYRGIEIPKDKERGIGYLARAADLNNLHSCFVYGKILIENKKFKEAIQYLLNAKNHGYQDDRLEKLIKKCEKKI